MRWLAFLLAIPLAGCASPCGSSTGWNFSVGKPPTVSSQAVLNQMPGAFAVSPLAAYPAAPASPAVMPLALDPCATVPTPLAFRSSRAAAFATTAQPCTLQDVCDKLDALTSRLNASKVEQLPMPKGQP